VKREVRERNLKVEVEELKREKGELIKKVADSRAALDTEKGSSLTKTKETQEAVATVERKMREAKTQAEKDMMEFERKTQNEIKKAQQQSATDIAHAKKEAKKEMEETRRDAAESLSEKTKVVEADVTAKFQGEIKILERKLEDAMGQLCEEEKAKFLITQEAEKKAAAAAALSKEASNLSGRAKAEATKAANNAKRIADEAANRANNAVRDAAKAQAQKQQRELTIDTLMKRADDAEAELNRRSEEWRIEKNKFKEDYKKEVESVRERLWENRTLDQMVKTTETRANAAEAENRRLAEELKVLKQQMGRSFDMPLKPVRKY